MCKLERLWDDTWFKLLFILFGNRLSCGFKSCGWWDVPVAFRAFYNPNSPVWSWLLAEEETREMKPCIKSLYKTCGLEDQFNLHLLQHADVCP